MPPPWLPVMTTENDTAPPIAWWVGDGGWLTAPLLPTPLMDMDMNVRIYSPGGSTQCGSSDSEDECCEILRVYQGSDNLEVVERQVRPYLCALDVEIRMLKTAEEAAERSAAARAAAAAAHAEAEKAAENAVRLAANAVRSAAALSAWDAQLHAELATARSLDEAVHVAHAAAAAAVAAAELFN